MRRRYSKILLILIFSALMIGCDDSYISSIPDVPVYLDLNLTTTYPTFKSPNKFLEFSKPRFVTDRIGYGGILVYIGFDNKYYAFDMSCPYEHKSTIKVHANELGQAVCDSCKSVFDLGYGIGNSSSGKANEFKESLRRYKANLMGDVLYVTR